MTDPAPVSLSYRFADPDLAEALIQAHFIWCTYSATLDAPLGCIIYRIKMGEPIHHDELHAVANMLSAILQNWPQVAVALAPRIAEAEGEQVGRILQDLYMDAHTALEALVASNKLVDGPVVGHA